MIADVGAVGSIGGKRETLLGPLFKYAEFGICGNMLERIRMSLCGFLENCRADPWKKGVMIVSCDEAAFFDVADHLRFGAIRNAAETEMRRMTLRHGRCEVQVHHGQSGLASCVAAERFLPRFV